MPNLVSRLQTTAYHSLRALAGECSLVERVLDACTCVEPVRHDDAHDLLSKEAREILAEIGRCQTLLRATTGEEQLQYARDARAYLVAYVMAVLGDRALHDRAAQRLRTRLQRLEV